MDSHFRGNILNSSGLSGPGQIQKLAPRLWSIGKEMRFGVFEIAKPFVGDTVALEVFLHLVRADRIYPGGVESKNLGSDPWGNFRVPMSVAQVLGNLKHAKSLDLILRGAI